MTKTASLLIFAWALLGVISAFPVAAQVPPAPAPPAAADKSSPYQLNLLYTGELWDNAQGGIRQGSTYMYNVDAGLFVDTDRAFGWTGGRFVLEGFYQSHNSISNSFVDGADWQSPLDSGGVATFRLYQAYYNQTFGATDIRFGIYDLETEFSVTKPMQLFLSKNLTWNTALDEAGTAPMSGSIGPGNYPYTPLALRIRQTINDHWSIQGVIADGAADNPNNPAQNAIIFSSRYGALGIGEVDYTPSRYTKAMVGIWGMTSKLPTNNITFVDGTPHDIYGEGGIYFGGATRLYHGEGRRGLDGFFTIGASSPQSTNVNGSFNAGLVYTGPFAERPLDKAGISVAMNANPTSYRLAQIAAGSSVTRYETNLEVTYRAKITSWLTVQPDFQYIIHPGYDPTVRNDFLIGLHFEIGRFFNL